MKRLSMVATERDAGKEVLRLFLSGGGCPLCHYGDHDNDGGERHQDECSLRILDSLDYDLIKKLKKKYQ